jgi:sarcosine oxidase
MGALSSEVCVVGGGVIGLAAATSLRDRGVDVVCFERSRPGQAQSAGRTRQFRHLHADPELIELAIRARHAWREWERRFDRTLLGPEGVLRAGAAPGELAALRAAGLPAEELDAQAAAEVFPIAAVPDAMLLWDPLAGAIRAQETVMALTAGLADALQRAEIESIDIAAGGDSVRLHTSAGVHRSARCIVCAGAGTDRLVRPLGIDLHQIRNAHVRLSFRARTAPSKPLPCFSDRGGGSELIYALSDLNDLYAIGLSELTTYPALEDLADELPPDVDLGTQRDRLVAYVRQALPGLDPEPVDEVRCVTTTLPDQPDDGFASWRQGPVVAFAGTNLFKFAPVIGACLADAVTAQDAAVSTAPGTPVAPSR